MSRLIVGAFWMLPHNWPVIWNSIRISVPLPQPQDELLEGGSSLWQPPSSTQTNSSSQQHGAAHTELPGMVFWSH